MGSGSSPSGRRPTSSAYVSIGTMLAGVRAFVAEHGYAVGGDVHVALERADAQVERRAEGREGVLGRQRSTAAMGLQVEAGSAQEVS